MRRRVNIIASLDWYTIILFLALVFLGWINIYAAEYKDEYKSIFSFSQRYGKQFIWVSAAILIATLLLLIDSKFYSLVPYLIYFLSLLLLIAVLIVGKQIKGAKSWFQFGAFYFQPSELAKFGTSLALAKFLSTYNVSMKKFSTWVIIIIIIGLPMALIAFQPDYGSTLVYFALLLMLFREGLSSWIFALCFYIPALFILTLLLDKLILLVILLTSAFIVFWILNKSLKNVILGLFLFFLVSMAGFILNKYVLPIRFSNYYLLLLITGASGFVYLILTLRKKIRGTMLAILFLILAGSFTYSVDYMYNDFLKEHQRNRVNILLGIESDPLGLEYNVNQSKIAIGSGGFSGKGFLKGTQTKLDFVPEQSTDFIFCTVGEEWGFIGTTFVILLFVIFLLRILFIAERQRSKFSRIYAYCVFSILFFHIVVNIGMTIDLLPVIGIPLPFFSYGGSSLWAFTLLLFVLLRLDASRMELLR